MCECALLCLLPDMAAVFQSVCVIMRPQGAENSDPLTWKEKYNQRQRGWAGGSWVMDALILIFYQQAQKPDES